MQRPALTSSPFGVVVSCCISAPFGTLSTTRGLITYVLLTRAPLYRGRSPFSLDLHVLGAPLTFVLSQDQTLQLNPEPIEGSLSSCELLFRDVCWQTRVKPSRIPTRASSRLPAATLALHQRNTWLSHSRRYLGPYAPQEQGDILRRL